MPKHDAAITAMIATAMAPALLADVFTPDRSCGYREVNPAHMSALKVTTV